MYAHTSASPGVCIHVLTRAAELFYTGAYQRDCAQDKLILHAVRE